MTDRRPRRPWHNVLGGVVVFLAEAAVVVAMVALAFVVAAVALWLA